MTLPPHLSLHHLSLARRALILGSLLCLGLPPLTGLAQTEGGPRCNVGSISVRISTFLPQKAGAGVQTMIEAAGVSAGRTDPNGLCMLNVDPCSSAERIVARPVTINYCSELHECAKDLPIEIFEGCSPASTVLEGGAEHVPWYRELLTVLSGQIPEQVEGEEISALSQSIFENYDKAQFFQAAFDAGNLTRQLIEVNRVDLAWSTSALQLDAAFRAVGLEPATAEAPLMQRFEDGRVLPTPLGLTALVAMIGVTGVSEIVPESPDGIAPIVLQDSAFDVISAVAAAFPPVLHPTVAGDLEVYIRSFLN